MTVEVEMSEELAKGGTPAARAALARPIEYLIVIVGLLLCVAIYLVLGVVKHMEAVQRDGVQRGYMNRAVTCDLQRGLGLTESKGCNDESIEQYRDATVLPSSTAGAKASIRSYNLLCFVLKQASLQPGSTIVLPPGQCAAS